MELLFWTQVGYLAISAVIAGWVGQTLHKHGRHFLKNCFFNNERVVDSVNDALLVGFYLMNIGFAATVIRYKDEVIHLSDSVVMLADKIGFILLVLGAAHTFNLIILRIAHHQALMRRQMPPVMPDGHPKG